jgi:tRNA(Ile)-lysidine synthase
MASLKKLPANNKTSLTRQLQAFLKDVFLSQRLINPKLLLGLSGGLDSVVLLHLLADANKVLPFKLSAHHVHHGLSPNADTWANFCADYCKELNIPLTVSKVKVSKNSGLGMESAARNARYQALFNDDADLICVAHHQDDQAETLLLQLARGAGVKGLASMAAVNKLPKPLLRPFLEVSRCTLEAYANIHKLTWIEDESNFDTKFDRNFIRHEVLPVLSKQYPAIRQTLARAANHLAEADMLLDELALFDISACQPDQSQLKTIKLEPLLQLSDARIHNALRYWIRQHACDMPSTAHLTQIRHQLFDAKPDARIKIKLSESLVLRRFQGSAFIVDNDNTSKKSNEPIAFCLMWKGEKTITLPDQSRLIFSEETGTGIAMRHLENSKLLIRYRQGGEILKPALNRPSRSLKYLFQSSNIPPWLRERLPLLFLNDELVVVTGIAVDAKFVATPDEVGLCAHWQF